MCEAFIYFLVCDIVVPRYSFVFLPLTNKSGIETSMGEASISFRYLGCGRLAQRAGDCMSDGVVKAILFLELEESTNLSFMSSGQVEMSLREDDQLLVMFASLIVEYDVVASDMLVVCEFPNMFLKDICDLLSE